MMLRGLGDCAYIDEDGNCLGVEVSTDPAQDPNAGTVYGTVGSTGAGGSLPVIVAPSTTPTTNTVPGTTLSTAQTAAQISNAANQLLLTSQGRGVYTGPGGVQYIQPQGNASNVFAATNTTGSLATSGSIGGISITTLMLLGLAFFAITAMGKK